MSEHEDDAVDALLLAAFEGPMPDEGFCDNMMQRLPARRRYVWWPLAAGLAAGAALCFLTLQSAPLMRTGLRDWLSGQLSAPALTLLLVMAGISLLTLVWTMEEADATRMKS